MLLERLFSTGSLRPEDSMQMVIAGSADDCVAPVFTVPNTWRLEAAQTFAPALCQNIPASRTAVEENTMPSWLWQRRAQGSERRAESSVLDVYDRIAASAAYKGWKMGLWHDEVTASTFYDEVKALLLTRRFVLSAEDMSKLGLDWAYGIQSLPLNSLPTSQQNAEGLILQNETIDFILKRTQPLAQSKWEDFLHDSLDKNQTKIAFADTIAEWGVSTNTRHAPRGLLNLLAFRTEAGNLDLAGLEQATKLAVLLMEIHYDSLSLRQDPSRPLSLSFGNLSTLLMSLAIPYDSQEGRTTAASLAALVTATATATSAHIASIIGTCPAFTQGREACLRALRNSLRASFGEKNDYEHLSVLPQTIEIDSGADLVLISKARYAQQEALRLTQAHGLRHSQLTAMFDSHEFASLMDCAGQGIEPLPALTFDYAVGEDQYTRVPHPALALGLEKLGYDEADCQAIIDHVVGYKTLKGSPAINHAYLQDKGFDQAALAKIEAVLPFVDNLRFAFTPWVLGLGFCCTALGLHDSDLANPHLDILRYLGFSSKEIAIANAFCCGHRSVKGVLELKEKDRSVFEAGPNLGYEPLICMAGAVQSFIMGDVNLHLAIPSSLSAPLRGDFVIQAWQHGLKSLCLESEAPFKAGQEEVLIVKRTGVREKAPHMLSPSRIVEPNRGGVFKPKAASRSVSLKQQGGTKSQLRSKRS